MTQNDDYSMEVPERLTLVECAAFVVGIALCVGICSAIIISAGPSTSPEQIVLDGRINVNTASVASLERLPGIGISRAKAIVTYRRRTVDEDHPRAFKRLADLENIKGIGPKTAAALEQYVRFE